MNYPTSLRDDSVVDLAVGFFQEFSADSLQIQEIEYEEKMKSIIGFSAIAAVCFTLVSMTIHTDAQESESKRDDSTATKQSAESTSAVVTCGCCVSGGAAQTSPVIMALDIDKDGRISAIEIKNAVQSLLALDTNGDGHLDRHEMHARSEFSAINASNVSKLQLGVTRDYYAQMMLLRDKNGNGQLEKEEMNAATLAILEFIDANGDGVLTYDELKNMNQQIKSRRK